MKSDDSIKMGVNSALSAAGFRLKRSTWYLDLDETVLVVGLQKSRFGDQFYVNLAVFIKALSPAHGPDLPTESRCHIRVRLETLAADVESINRTLDMTVVVPGRQALIEGATEKLAIPFLLACSNLQDLRDALRSGKLENAFVHREVRSLLA